MPFLPHGRLQRKYELVWKMDGDHPALLSAYFAAAYQRTGRFIVSNSFVPYHIDHCRFENWQGSTDLKNFPAYCVFWYREIPLGHLWLAMKPGSITEWLQKVIVAITPAVNFYQIKSRLTNINWQQLILDQNRDAWQSFLQQVTTGVLANTIPAEVPISVIICTRHRPAFLDRCLENLLVAPCRPQEIIVVDNGTGDNETKKIVSALPGVIYCTEKKQGLDLARNTGIGKAGNEVVAFVDDDVIIDPYWAFRVWQTFEDPAVDGLAGLVLASAITTEAQYIFEKHWSFNRGYVPVEYDEHFIEMHLKKAPPVWQIGAGANMAFRKTAFEKVGYFDERLDAGAAGCSGDSELWFRMLTGGLTIRYQPLAVVQHEHRSTKKALQDQLFFYMRGFVVAALLQQRQMPACGYSRHLWRHLPKYYLYMLWKGFPFYKGSFMTLRSEVKGWMHGWRYYKKHCT